MFKRMSQEIFIENQSKVLIPFRCRRYKRQSFIGELKWKIQKKEILLFK